MSVNGILSAFTHDLALAGEHALSTARSIVEGHRAAGALISSNLLPTSAAVACAAA